MGNIRNKIILVDDNMSNLTMGKSILQPFYKTYPAPSATTLFEMLENMIPDLILLDIEMPEINGFEAIKKLKADERFKDIPVIFLTVKNDEKSELEGLELGAVDYVSKPFSAPILLKRIANYILIEHQKKDLFDSKAQIENYANNLEMKVKQKTKEVLKLKNAILTTLANLVEFRDENTGGHITRTMMYLAALLNEMFRKKIYFEEISKWNMETILPSSQLHDIGKIAISDLILNKPGELTPEEFEIMKTHVNVGVEAIRKMILSTRRNVFLNQTMTIAKTHHEKWDGSGYPAGLKGKAIPLEGRLMAIADVYDALVSERPYKKALTHEEASRIIDDGSGSHFDPTLVEVFHGVKDEFATIVEKVDD